MTQPQTSSRPEAPSVAAIPAAPILVAGLRDIAWVGADGEASLVPPDEAGARARKTPPLVCHAPLTARRLGIRAFPAYDVLELYAFVRPARFCVPTPRGLADAVALAPPGDLFAAASVLRTATARLLAELTAADPHAERDAGAIAMAMGRGGWPWAPFVLTALGLDASGNTTIHGGLNVWDRLPSWNEQAPPPPAGQRAVTPAEARGRLADLLGRDAEARPQQADYASAVSHAFTPPDAPEAPQVVLAEAGTGVGKTLGYIAPASVWAEKNEGPVWISTYTRNLQRQLDAELDRLYPAAREKAARVVVRKGRENYLCLLNLEETVRALPVAPQAAVATGLMVRWSGRTRDGDMAGGDFPGWLSDLLGRAGTLGLTDRRGECIYSACPHYGRCFIERGLRRARHARLVVANHALVMIQAALGGGEDGELPTRYVFDEGHHLLDAADNAFAAHLSGQESQALRRWLLGAEGEGRTARRARGLQRRTEDLIAGDGEMQALLAEILRAARALPGGGWHQRLGREEPIGPTERFLAAVRTQVYARAPDRELPYSLETDVRPVSAALAEASGQLRLALARLADPMARFRAGLAQRLDDEAARLDSEGRRRIEATCRGIERRALLPLAGWQAMLTALEAEPPDAFVDWLAVERSEGRDVDVGLFRHWIDPTEPFAATVLARAHGAAITSATLTDGSGDAEADWAAAEARVGTTHLAAPAVRARVPSPFAYAEQTRVFVVGDVRANDWGQIAAAYRELFLASGGGALGLFTAVRRLREIHARIGAPLEAAGLSLYAQHVDPMDIGTLIDIFRAEENSCLLGTDAVRDGVDVPGRSLRLIVFDRVPWPRPDILHRARRAHFGGRAFDDRLTRLRLKQAYGRLVRRADDRGVFVLLDPRLPSRLAGAFPDGVAINRVGLAEAIAETSAFLRAKPPPEK